MKKFFTLISFGCLLSLSSSIVLAQPSSELLANGLAQNFISRRAPEKLSWDWGAAVFMYGLSQYANRLPEGESKAHWVAAIQKYHDHHFDKKIPKIDRSDRCPSALSALSLVRDFKNDRYLSQLNSVLHYLQTEPRNKIGALNHLGHSWLRFFFPDSIWVDSLMMTTVFEVQAGSFLGREDLIQDAIEQPKIFANKLQDPKFHLFRHAWIEKSDRVIPKSETFWLRGNAWVLVSLVEMLAEVKSNPDLEKILNELASAVIEYRRPSGLYGTVINDSTSYEESSGSALVAYAFLKGVRLGFLDQRYKVSALATYEGLVKKLKITRNGYSLTGNSGPTNPSSRWLYKHIARVNDAPYGVGGFLLLSSEMIMENGK